jgi:phosphotransacetylase
MKNDTITIVEEEMTDEQWQEYYQKIVEENRRKIKEQQANRNSTAPWEK